MPEAPEVKIITDSIAQFLEGGILTGISIANEAFRKRTKDLDRLAGLLPLGVTKVGTKGKFGYIVFSDGTAIGIGYGMTGNIRIEPTEAYLAQRKETRAAYMKHAAVRFDYVDREGHSGTFYYHSVRRFGYVWYLSASDFAKKLDELGPSILDTPLDKERLLQRWRRSNTTNVCVVLLEKQNLISGIGNYIKAEALYRAKVHPMALLRSLSDETLYTLYSEACAIAREAYSAGGASLYTFTGLHGDRSDFKDTLAVYNRRRDPEGREVLQMDTPDKRNTHWVPEVQVLGVETKPIPIPAKVEPKARIKVSVRVRQTPVQ